MFARAVVAFLALPGVIGFALPLGFILLTSNASLAHPVGLVPLGAGFVGLFWCVRDFHAIGRGTLAPWAPPANLVIVGLYHYSRNPMYVSVVLILVGWTIVFGSGMLTLYAAAVAVGFHLRVVSAEEPYLERTHGEAWRAYAARVPRWLGRPG